MISKGFFSMFVAAFAVILLISFFYSQSVQFSSQAREAEISVLQQGLSKDWFMTRNALTNFAADAMLNKISQSPPTTSSCSIHPATDYGPDVNAYWHDAVQYMNKNFGTNCDVNVSGDVQLLMEGPAVPINEIRSGLRAYGLLSCTRTTSTATLSVKRPFVIRKDVRTSVVAGSGCEVSIFDILGNNPAKGINFEKLDVKQAFP